jgi:hypothetical protein
VDTLIKLLRRLMLHLLEAAATAAPPSAPRTRVAARKAKTEAAR